MFDEFKRNIAEKASNFGAFLKPYVNGFLDSPFLVIFETMGFAITGYVLGVTYGMDLVNMPLLNQLNYATALDYAEKINCPLLWNPELPYQPKVNCSGNFSKEWEFQSNYGIRLSEQYFQNEASITSYGMKGAILLGCIGFFRSMERVKNKTMKELDVKSTIAQPMVGSPGT